MFGPNFFFVELLRPFVNVDSDFYLFAVSGTLKIIKNFDFLTWDSNLYALVEHTGKELMCALKARVSVYAEHTRQEQMHALSIRIMNWCMH